MRVDAIKMATFSNFSQSVTKIKANTRRRTYLVCKNARHNVSQRLNTAHREHIPLHIYNKHIQHHHQQQQQLHTWSASTSYLVEGWRGRTGHE